MRSIILVVALVGHLTSLAQTTAYTFEHAATIGKSYTHLDSIYKSAVHSDTLLAVFRSEADQQKLMNAYTKLLRDLGQYLKANNFKWERPTRCFNRIYLSADGKIEYFLYHFLPDKNNPELKVSDTKQQEFERLLNEFSKTYQFTATAKERFAQCSPVVYSDK